MTNNFVIFQLKIKEKKQNATKQISASDNNNNNERI